jgi:hypothetical protein
MKERRRWNLWLIMIINILEANLSVICETIWNILHSFGVLKLVKYIQCGHPFT